MMIYVCTRMQKSAEEDSYEHGCDPKTFVWTCDESCDLRAATMVELLAKLCNRYALAPFDSYWVSEENNSISSNRLETVDGEEPSEVELEQWRDGKLKLYLADYTFFIEKRTVEPLTDDDFVGVPCHD